MKGFPISVTDIRPGYIYSDLSKDFTNMFWVVPMEKAISQMVRAIEKKKRVAYISRRWKWVAFLQRHLPDWLFYSRFHLSFKKVGNDIPTL